MGLLKCTAFLTTAIVALMGTQTTISLAQTTYQTITRAVATQSGVEVQVGPGRSTTINFAQTGERISYILLADPSRVTYTSNAPLESGKAQILFLRPIQPLRFPGATTSPITNLMVQTIDGLGRQRLYSFDIIQAEAPQYLGVTILPQAIDTASLGAIERGLRIAISKGYTRSSDPIVGRIRRMIGLVRDNGVPISTAAKQTGIPTTVLAELERLATAQDIQRRLQPLEPPPVPVPVTPALPQSPSGKTQVPIAVGV